MLRVVVLSLLYIGSANMYTSGEYKKFIKKSISNRDREALVIRKIDEHRANQLAFEKKLENQVTAFQTLYDEDNITQAGMIEYFDQVEDLYAEYYILRVNDRMELAGILTEKDWKKMFSRYKRKHSTIVNARVIRKAYLDDEIDKTKRAMGRSIKDQVEKKKLLESIENIRLIFHEFYDASDKINFVENPVLSNQLSTKEEILVVYGEWGKARENFYDALISETDKMSVYLTTAEWKTFLNNLKSEFN